MSLRGVPTTAELVESVREFLRDEVMPETVGAVNFNTRVAANVLGIVERELALGGAREAAHAERLQALGVADDVELAAVVRERRDAGREDEVVAALRRSTRERLAIDNPRYLLPEDRELLPEDSPARTIR